MSEDLDSGLLARFTAVREQRLDDQFIGTLLLRLDAQRRRDRYRQAAMAGAVLLLLAWKLPALLSWTARLADGLVGTLVVPAVQASSAPAGISAAGWGVSLLVGALVLWRTSSLRRR
jgi:hypothetical protein